MANPRRAELVANAVLRSLAKRKARQKARKQRPETKRRDSKAQAERSPMLGVRVPRALYTQLQQAAKADQRTLADWLRLNLPRLVECQSIESSERSGRAIIVSGKKAYEIAAEQAVEQWHRTVQEITEPKP